VYRAGFTGATLRLINFDNIRKAKWDTVEGLSDSPVYLLPDMAK
jgi:hypothetical protein